MRSVLITGASSGFGAKAGVELARRGWHVFASMRDTSKSGYVRHLADASGVEPDAISVIELDVTSESSRQSGVKHLLSASPSGPDMILHCAGYTTASFFEDIPPAKIRHLFDTNFFGALDITQKLLPSMRERRSGTIAVISSNAVNIAHPMYSIYAAAKWALEGWAEALEIELAPFNLDVKIIQPGNHDTNFGSNVELMIDESSAYSDLAALALPRMEKLGGKARSADKATREICDALELSRRKLRTRIGSDDKLMAALSRWAPYSTRRILIEKITGITAGTKVPAK
ncbi:SDR family oxidoreductase [Nocardia rhamnosiphila]|uniref:SDR family oxidoreductase n=1 Tax=Nocardia rhamnosiphila TaxID=426716 RepID=UPI0033D4D68F